MIGFVLALSTHVPTWIYGGFQDYNASWSPARLAAFATFAEFSEYDLARLRAYKRAGGAHAYVYVDPSLVPYCTPPFRPPAGACRGPFGASGPPESAWFHQADGERARRADSYTHQYQEYLNPADSAARAVVRGHTEELVRQAPIDGFFADDTGSSLIGGDGTPASGIFYGFDTVGVEVRSDAGWLTAERSMIAAIARPVVLNGGDVDTWLPAYGGAFLAMPHVTGAAREGCFSTDDERPMTSLHHHWEATANALLAITALGRQAICMETGAPTPRVRMYDFTSWLLTYNARFSVLAPIWETADHHNVYSEITLVPNVPAGAPRSLDDLRAGGVYARSFAQCTADGRSIGACMAVVNPTNRAQALPGGARRFHWSMQLDAKSIDAGGAIEWKPLRSSVLPPASALIVSERSSG